MTAVAIFLSVLSFVVLAPTIRLTFRHRPRRNVVLLVTLFAGVDLLVYWYELDRQAWAYLPGIVLALPGALILFSRRVLMARRRAVSARLGEQDHRHS
jgi:hypothetical protein